jgi:hypothetical protein
MNERIKELAEQAGLARLHNDEFAAMGDKDLERFAELVRQDEREACAKAMQPMLRDMISRGQAADIIRARGNT